MIVVCHLYILGARSASDALALESQDAQIAITAIIETYLDIHFSKQHFPVKNRKNAPISYVMKFSFRNCSLSDQEEFIDIYTITIRIVLTK